MLKNTSYSDNSSRSYATWSHGKAISMPEYSLRRNPRVDPVYGVPDTVLLKTVAEEFPQVDDPCTIIGCDLDDDHRFAFATEVSVLRVGREAFEVNRDNLDNVALGRSDVKTVDSSNDLHAQCAPFSIECRYRDCCRRGR